MRPEVLGVMAHVKGDTWERTEEQSAVLTDCAMLCLFVCWRVLSDAVYFSEGRFTSGSLGMNGELISPTETSQSFHIYSPPLQWPLPSQVNNGTQVNCRWVRLKARPYIPGTSILLQRLSEIKGKHCTEARGVCLGGWVGGWGVLMCIQFSLNCVPQSAAWFQWILKLLKVSFRCLMVLCFCRVLASPWGMHLLVH